MSGFLARCDLLLRYSTSEAAADSVFGEWRGHIKLRLDNRFDHPDLQNQSPLKPLITNLVHRKSTIPMLTPYAPAYSEKDAGSSSAPGPQPRGKVSAQDTTGEFGGGAYISTHVNYRDSQLTAFAWLACSELYDQPSRQQHHP